MRRLAISILGLSLSAATLASSTGPTQTPLKVTGMYTKDQGTIYVSFQAGSMPGCYGSSGGYLLSGNSNYKEIYAQLLMLVATGGVRAAVLYTQNPQTNNWSDCYLDGIYLMPE